MNLQMDNFAMQKDEVELALARTLLTKLEKAEIPYPKGQEMARFILAGIDGATNSQELLQFLQVLVAKWEMFSNTYSLFRMKAADTAKTHNDLAKAKEQLAHIPSQ